MLTVTELPEFQKQVKGHLTPEALAQLIDYLAVNPEIGDIVQGTGGIRKLRWRTQNKGKQGGVRVIYYYHSPIMPLYLLTLYKKGIKLT